MDYSPDNLRALGGLVFFFALAWALGGFRRPPLGLIVIGVTFQVAVLSLVFATPGAPQALFALSQGVDALQAGTRAGTSFVFGYVGGGPAPFDTREPQLAISLAFQILPLVLVISALSAVLWRWRVLPLITGAFAFLFRRLLGLSGAASLATAANIFLGMVESPVLVRPYLARLSKSDLFVVMTAGLATVAGTVLVIYAAMLGPVLPDAAGHVIAASIMSAPAAIIIARLMVPQARQGDATEADQEEAGEGGEAFDPAKVGPRYTSTMDALTTGVTDGLKLYLNIIAMLIVFVALVALANGVLGVLPWVGGAPISVERLFGWGFQPLMWLMGVPWSDAGAAGVLFGYKTALNEFIAYERLIAASEVLQPRTTLILTYALCGFANFGGLGIMLAGLITMVPERKELIVSLGLKSLVSGSLATIVTGCVVAAAPMALFGF